MDEIYDLIIVGGGPGGLSAAVYAGRSQLKTLLLEKGHFGGRIKDTKEICNYPGVKIDSGIGLMEKFKSHAEQFSTVTFMRTTVTGISKQNSLQVVHTKRRGDFKAKAVILDVGTKPRSLNIPGEKEFIGEGVAYCATCDGEFFKGQHIYVLGAGDQAIEESEYLTKFASRVTIIVLHEEGHLDCNEIAAKQAFQNPKIDFIWNSTLSEIRGRDHVEKLAILNVINGQMTEVDATGIFIFVGMEPQTEFIRSTVECNKCGYIKVNERKETNIPGVYAVGDCTQTYLRQVITAAADGAIAAVASERYMKEREQLDHLLSADSGKVGFIFYTPYEEESLNLLTIVEKTIEPHYHLYCQDITKQSLLYHELHLTTNFAVAIFLNGQVQSIFTREQGEDLHNFLSQLEQELLISS